MEPVEADGWIKHKKVRDAIMEAIRTGEFSSDGRLPSEREMARRFGVSYMTARRAVTEMVEADLLERRERKGTYLRSHSPDKIAATTVNLICEASESALLRTFLRQGAQAVEERGWRHHVIRIYHGHDRSAVRAIESGEMALVLGASSHHKGPLGEAMQKAEGRVVLIGNRMDKLGVPSVLADDAQSVRLAVNHLQGAGHSAIALISNHPEHAVDRVQIAAWLACFPDVPKALIKSRLIAANTPLFGNRSDCTYHAVRRYLAAPAADATALICLGDEMSIAAVSACFDAGRVVPQKMSLVNLGDSSIMAYCLPHITCINVHLERHIQLAMESLEAAMRGEMRSSHRLRLVQPHLVERDSVAPPAARN